MEFQVINLILCIFLCLTLWSIYQILWQSFLCLFFGCWIAFVILHIFHSLVFLVRRHVPLPSPHLHKWNILGWWNACPWQIVSMPRAYTRADRPCDWLSQILRFPQLFLFLFSFICHTDSSSVISDSSSVVPLEEDPSGSSESSRLLTLYSFLSLNSF